MSGDLTGNETAAKILQNTWKTWSQISSDTASQIDGNSIIC